MRFRARNLACLLLLLSAIGVAQGVALPTGEFSPGARYVRALFHASVAQTRTSVQVDTFPHLRESRAAQTLSPSAKAAHHVSWTMPAPAAHATQVQTFTASLRS